jgi:hypothetical protein
MKKKTAFTGMLAAVFALAVTGSLAAQARAVRPPREFVGTWHVMLFGWRNLESIGNGG